MGMVSVIRFRIAHFINRCRVITTNKSLKGLKINKNRVLKALTSLISSDKGLLRESLGPLSAITGFQGECCSSLFEKMSFRER